MVIQPGLDCSNPEKWAGQQSVRFRIQKRYADITYALPGVLRNNLAPMSGIVDSTYVPAESYLTFYDAILPAGYPDVKSIQLMLLARCSTATLLGRSDYLYLISTLPWRVQLPSPVLGYSSLTDDNIIKASTCVTVARIMLAWGSLWVFGGFTIVIIIWSMARLTIYSRRIRMPPIAPFPDLDLAIKLIRSHKKSGTDTDVAELFWRLETLDSRDIKATLGEVRLKIREPRDPPAAEGDIEMRQQR